MSHTPGPWKFGRTCDSVVIEGSERINKSHIEYYGDRHLISAAPELLEACIKANEVLEAILSFYGQNLQVHGWHLNGDAEPFDSFIDENLDGNEMELLYKAISKAKGEDL